MLMRLLNKKRIDNKINDKLKKKRIKFMTGEKYFRQSKNFHKVSCFLLFRQLINYDYEFFQKKIKSQKSEKLSFNHNRPNI